MAQIKIQNATAEFSREGTQMILSTMGEFGTYLFGFGDEDKAFSALERLFLLKKNRFSHQHVLFGFSGAAPAGLVVVFDRAVLFRSMAVTAFQLLNIYNTKELFLYLKRILPYRADELISKDELYIAHLAVQPDFRRKGIATILLEWAAAEAVRQNKPVLSLLVEMENKPAISLYEKFGFKIIEEHTHPKQKALTGSLGDYKMIMNMEQEKK